MSRVKDWIYSIFKPKNGFKDGGLIKRQKDRYRIHFRYKEDENGMVCLIDRPEGLGYGLWGGNDKIIIRCLNNFY